MVILPKAIYKFSAVPTKISTQFFIDLENTVSVSYEKKNHNSITKAILNNKRTAGDITSPDVQVILQNCSDKNHMALAQNQRP